MRVLIVEENLHRGALWKRFLERSDAKVDLVSTTEEATSALSCRSYDSLVINIAMANAAILAISDLASYRNPDIAIVTVTSGSFFSDGSIFKMIPNACGCVGGDVLPMDLVEIVSYYANRPKNRDHEDATNHFLG
jgi:DNA-binding NtrC family response regulator